MTNVAPGWYPDATTPGQQRWWDGTQWTENVQLPYTPGALRVALKAPEGVTGNTPWIWLIVALLVLQLIAGTVYTLSFDMTTYMDDAMDQALNGTYVSPYAAMMTPGYWIQIALDVVMYVAWVLLAFFDHRELKRRGVPRPFHWAFSFIPWVDPYVYLIGRSIVVRMRTGSGLAPMIIGLVLGAVGFVIGMVLGIAMSVDMLDSFNTGFQDGFNESYYGE